MTLTSTRRPTVCRSSSAVTSTRLRSTRHSNPYAQVRDRVPQRRDDRERLRHTNTHAAPADHATHTIRSSPPRPRKRHGRSSPGMRTSLMWSAVHRPRLCPRTPRIIPLQASSPIAGVCRRGRPSPGGCTGGSPGDHHSRHRTHGTGPGGPRSRARNDHPLRRPQPPGTGPPGDDRLTTRTAPGTRPRRSSSSSRSSLPSPLTATAQ